MQFNEFGYIGEHGIRPRGRGSWAFQPGDGAGHVYSDVQPVWSPSMTYTEAKRWVKERLSGYAEVYVLP